MIRRAERIFTIKIIEGRKVLWWSLKFSPTTAAEWTFLLTTTFSGKKKRKGTVFSRCCQRLEGHFRSVRSYVSIQFSFSPGTFQFSPVLFSFHSSGYILELTTSSGVAATLYFVQRSPSLEDWRRLPETRRGMARAISALSRTPAAVPKWD